jgi:peptidoglycan hydrolase-like protein with peptidoglycan-binding domain
VSDPKVLAAQQWVNATYGAVSGYVRCPEDGRTGWSTMYALTRALQHELGITALSDSFGPTTLSKLTALGPIGTGTTNRNIVKIVQHGLFCKGYWGGAGDGVYDFSTITSVQQLKANMGVAAGDGFVQPKIFKALLTMDAYVLLAGGSEEILKIQRYLNGAYLDRSTFFVMPCDGHYSRDVQQALMKAIQYEIGIPPDQATGNFGPATQDGLRAHPAGPGTNATWMRLFSAACVFNGMVDNVITSFKTAWDDKIPQYVRAFQKFSVLEENGVGDYRTWAQLLVSTGDPDRPAGASDTRFHISTARARALVQAGYQVVGRYLDEDADSTLDKELQPGELDAIFAGGMRVFPISQYNGRSIDNFTYPQGYQHGLRAHARAVGYGFNRGTVIYFAVDYDATDEQITSNILPYFHGVQAGLANQGKRYIAGIYGSRNVCGRVSAEAYARYSFVSGMSWGFSGNLGFPMPSNWSFNQIKEFGFAAGSDSFDLDRDVHRPGSDPACGPENVNGTSSPVAAYLAYIDGLYATAVSYGGGDPSLRVLEYLRFPNYVDFYDGWETLIGDVDRAWIDYAKAHAPAKVTTFVDPSYGVTVNVDHFGATANAVLLKGSGPGSTPTGEGWRGDFGGWGGDLSTFYGEWRAESDQNSSGYTFCRDRLAKINVQSSFSFTDLIEDVDGYLIGTAVRGGAKVHEAIRAHIGGTGHLSRFQRFVSGRYGNTAGIIAAAKTMLCDVGPDDILDALRTAAIRKVSGALSLMPAWLPADKLDEFLRGYADTLQALVGQENARRAGR